MAERPVKLSLSIVGLVQGVGFRPHVARLAQKWGIRGEVSNNGGTVGIKAVGTAENLDAFIRDLMDNPPDNSEIIHASVDDLETPHLYEPEGFRISASGDSRSDIVVLPPDLPVCDACLSEMKDPGDRRYLHPFISCTNCGPRYSITRAVPYDRCNTSMADFPMCDKCAAEYTEENNRRLHAQTVSCHECGPVLVFLSESDEIEGMKALEKTLRVLREGGIIAVKGVGGYHFICDPCSDDAVSNLRRMKEREQKPFAVCFPDIGSIKIYHNVSAPEETLLLSKARPIVLLEKKGGSNGEADNPAPSFSGYVSQSSRYTGAFLPYTPVLHMITDRFGPVVATSANITNSPIIYRDRDIRKFSSPFLEGILTHTREIEVSQDDSVAWVVNGDTQILRRSRGYVPLPVHIPSLDGADMDTVVFAAGGHLKSTFCFLKGPYAFQSQYLGDLGTLESFTSYRENVEHMGSLLRLNPTFAVCDLHPEYQSTVFTQETGLRHIGVQHHHAHTAAVIAEHGLTGPVIGVSFDGTGYGTDGAIWGGEFLVCDEEKFVRAGHLRYLPILPGDESMRDAARTAQCFLEGLGLGGVIPDERYPVIRAALKKGAGVLSTSSMGRLFDAVSAILGICRFSRYEGEAAILLENAAADALRSGTLQTALDFDIMDEGGSIILDPTRMMNSLLDGVKNGISAGSLALRFHRAVAWAAVKACCRIRSAYSINTVALSGGVFQNRILAEEIKKGLVSEGFNVYSGRNIPPNDSGISLGQAYIGMKTLINSKVE